MLCARSKTLSSMIFSRRRPVARTGYTVLEQQQYLTFAGGCRGKQANVQHPQACFLKTLTRRAEERSRCPPMMRAAAANRQTSRNLMPQLRTHLTPARLTSKLNCPKVPGIALYRLFFLQQHATQQPHSSQYAQAPAIAQLSQWSTLDG